MTEAGIHIRAKQNTAALIELRYYDASGRLRVVGGPGLKSSQTYPDRPG